MEQETGKIEVETDGLTGTQPVAASLEVEIIRADGTRENLGVVAEWHAEEEDEDEKL